MQSSYFGKYICTQSDVFPQIGHNLRIAKWIKNIVSVWRPAAARSQVVFLLNITYALYFIYILTH